MPPAARLAETASQALAVTAFVLAPIPFGSVDPHWVAFWCVLLGASFALADLRGIGRFHRRYGAATLTLLLAWCVVVAMQQTTPSWPGLIDPIWEELSAASKAMPSPRAAATAGSPIMAAGLPLLFGLAFMRALLMGRTGEGANRLFMVMSIAIPVVGALSFVAYRLDPTSLLGQPKVFYRSSFTGTFVNSNTAATYFGSGAILWASRIPGTLWATRTRRLSGWRGRALHASDLITPKGILSALALLTCLGCVALTASRAGLILTLAGAMLASIASYRASDRARTKLPARQKSSWRSLCVALGATVLVALIGILADGAIGDRLQRFGLVDPFRLEVYRLCLAMIERYPWLGAGPGSFEVLLPSLRTATLGMSGIWDKAHSSLLELAVEMGLPFTVAVAGLWLASIAILAHRCRRPSGALLGNQINAAAFGVICLGSGHSLIDFPLQIAGYVVTFAAIAGCGLGVSGSFGALLPQSVTLDAVAGGPPTDLL